MALKDIVDGWIGWKNPSIFCCRYELTAGSVLLRFPLIFASILNFQFGQQLWVGVGLGLGIYWAYFMGHLGLFLGRVVTWICDVLIRNIFEYVKCVLILKRSSILKSNEFSKNWRFKNFILENSCVLQCMYGDAYVIYRIYSFNYSPKSLNNTLMALSALFK